MRNKKVIVMSTLLLAIILLGIGTIAYFRRTVNGGIIGNAGNLVLIVNQKNAVQNEAFDIVLKRSEEEQFIMPGDSGVFNLNIDSTGSSNDVAATIVVSRINLPDNLKFYLDSNYSEELTTRTYIIKKASNMTLTVPIYWYWNGGVSDENDTDFINQIISANMSVTATIAKTFYDTLLSQSYTLDTNVDFRQDASSSNGNGLMMMSSTQNDTYPIVYYRGNVNTNNVIYNDFCWLIVRTTETGGVKLVYNGEVNSDGSCNNYSNVTATKAYDENYINAYINKQVTMFNAASASPVYNGYMYNDDVAYLNGVTLDIENYKAHHSDFTIDNETGRHNQNKYNSTAKDIIDAWYVSNIDGKAEESLLEDTVWCSDRSVTSTTRTIDNHATNGYNFDFSTRTRISEYEEARPSIACLRDVDKFTVDRNNGNGDLTYPIGLLTADEMLLAGNNTDSVTEESPRITYLSIPTNVFLTMSPATLTGPYAMIFWVGSGQTTSAPVDINLPGLRPSVSIIHDSYIAGGYGTFESPYRIS